MELGDNRIGDSKGVVAHRYSVRLILLEGRKDQRGAMINIGSRSSLLVLMDALDGILVYAHTWLLLMVEDQYTRTL